MYKNIVVKHYNYEQWVGTIKAFFIEILMMHGTIISDEKTGIYNSCTWYISVLLITEYCLWCLLSYLSKRHDIAKVIIQMMPILSLGIYTYMYYNLGTTNNWRTHVFSVTNYGMLRSLAGMFLGIYIYYFARKAASRKGNWKLSIGICGGGTSEYPANLLFHQL